MKGYKAGLPGTTLVVTLIYLVAGQAELRASAAPIVERGRYIVEIGGCKDRHTASIYS